MTSVNEIAPDLFRLSIYVPDFDMQFNHFLVRDEQPLLFHAGSTEMLLDDSVRGHDRALQAGVAAEIEVWSP